MKVCAAVFAFVALAFSGTSAGPQVETVTVPTFGQVSVYRPSVAPTQVVLFISGDGGWKLGVVSMAERLRDLGALEDLSRAIQLKYKLAAYERPILVGYSSGATLVYGALASAPPESFAGALSLGFCPDLEIHTPLCQMRGLKATKRLKSVGYDLASFPGLRVPWMVLQGDADQVCAPLATQAFVGSIPSARIFSLPKVGHGFAVPRNWEPQFLEAYRAIANAPTSHDPPPVSVPEVRDLPLVEVSATGSSDHREMAIIVTGDGGWADLDKQVAAGFATAGVPTVGLSSLRYFWTPRTPEAAAADLARIITHYRARWRADHVILIGYSFGADVLPFLINRLDPAARTAVGSVALLGLGTSATFEFHVTEWIGRSRGPQYPTVPEVDRLTMPVVCVKGAGENDSACERIRNPKARVVTIGAGHHFSGDYSRLVDVILQRR
jgi:type IV secretory pathway VirJ component